MPILALLLYCGLAFCPLDLIARGPSAYDRKVDTDYYRSPKKQCTAFCQPEYEPIEEIQLVSPSYNYPCCENAIQEFYGNGELLQLKDGSMWMIAESDRAEMTNWERNDQVQVVPSTDVSFPYTITNRTCMKTVKALLKATPKQELLQD